MIAPRVLAALGTAAVLLVGCSETPTMPLAVRADNATAAEYTSECTPEMIICETPNPDDVSTWYDDGMEEAYASYADGGGEMDDWVETVNGCPSYAAGGTSVTLSVPTPEGTRRSVRIRSTGIWSMVFPIGANAARYNWPAGYWPAVDGSGAEVQIGQADGNCWVLGPLAKVSFGSAFYYVNARWPRRRGTVTPTSGGGTGGGSNCYQEYVFIEIDYGDGTGWHLLWEGWATVCG